MSAHDGRLQRASRAEVLKLARLLNREPDQLSYLDAVAPSDLRALREQVTEVLFASSSKTLNRLATASKLLPTGVVATITQRAFGPLLAARMTDLLDPSRAVDVAAKLPPDFLADIAIELDPRRASKVIAAIPVAHIRAITRELVAREEYVTMGRFVGPLPDASLYAALDEMDDRALLRIAFVLEHKERLDELLEQLGRQRVEGLLDVAADEELWPEVLDVLGHVGPPRQRELVELARGRDPETYARLEEFVRRNDPALYERLLEAVGGAGPSG